MSANQDRRGLRSEDRLVALRLFLQRSCVQLGVDALVVADDAGRPFAWSEDGVDPAEPGSRWRSWPLDRNRATGMLFARGMPRCDRVQIQRTTRGVTRILYGPVAV